MKDIKIEDREPEIWKPINKLKIDYTGLYEISSWGRVKSLGRITPDNRKIKERILKPRLDKYGYQYVNLSKNNKRKTLKIHRLVTLQFINNFKNFPEVNHKDGNKLNNYYENLEWCTAKINQRHAWKIGLKENVRSSTSKIGKKYALINNKKYKSKKVYCPELQKEFNSISNAAKFLNVSASGISACCKGEYKYAYKNPITGKKLTWRYI
jgi:hypothetical protein